MASGSLKSEKSVRISTNHVALLRHDIYTRATIATSKCKQRQPKKKARTVVSGSLNSEKSVRMSTRWRCSKYLSRDDCSPCTRQEQTARRTPFKPCPMVLVSRIASATGKRQRGGGASAGNA